MFKKTNMVLSLNEQKRLSDFVVLLVKINKRTRLCFRIAKKIKPKTKSKTKPRYKKKGLVIKHYEPTHIHSKGTPLVDVELNGQ